MKDSFLSAGQEASAHSVTPAAILGQFVERTVASVITGKPVRIFFDNDGTTFPFVADPNQVRMDEGCFAGLVRLTNLFNIAATSLTGRDVQVVRDLMLTPGYEVRNGQDEILVPSGDKALRFSIIGSHGVEYMHADGMIERYDFSQGAKDFIAAFHQEGVQLRDKYPGIHVELKHGSLGVNVKLIAEEGQRKRAHAEALQLMQRYVNSPEHPLYDGQKIFAVKRESEHELELRPDCFGKDFGIMRFGDGATEDTTLFLCDSLGEEGTDKPAAALINDKTKFPDGHVVMVLNGRTAPPPPDAPHSPEIIVASPAELGQLLQNMAQYAELQNRSAPVPARQYSTQGLHR